MPRSRLFADAGTFHLSWRSHDVSLNRRLSSATEDEVYPSREDALRRAEIILFGLLDSDWTFRADGEPVTSDDVASIRDRALVVHQVDLALGLEGLVLTQPILHRFDFHSGESADLWIVLGASEDDYLVFYDPHDGGYGLASGSDPHRLTYSGDYGSLWETIESL